MKKCSTNLKEEKLNEVIKIKRNKKFKISHILFFVCILVLGVWGSILAFNKLNNSNTKANNILYVKNKETMYTTFPEIKTEKLSDVALDSKENHYFYSSDGRYLFYPHEYKSQSKKTYYYRDLKSKFTDDKAVFIIDSEISKAKFTYKEDKFFYVKGNQNMLYVFDLKTKQSQKIDNDINEFYINKDGTYIAYEKKGNTVYQAIIAENLKTEKVDSDSVISQFSDKNDAFVYSKGKGEIYLKRKDEFKVQIDSEVKKVLSFNKSNQLYYTKVDELTKILVKNTVDYIVDYMVDNNIAKYIIKEVSSQLNFPIYSLYFFDGDKSVKIDDKFLDGDVWSDNKNMYIYKRLNIDNFKMDLSGVTEITDVQYILGKTLETAIDHCVVVESGAPLRIESTNGTQFVINKFDDTIYFLDEYEPKHKYGTLIQIKTNDTGIAEINKIDSDVHYSFYMGNETEKVYYFKDFSDISGDLYENGEKIASNVYDGGIFNFKNTSVLMYLTNYNSENGILKMYKNKKETIIANEVYRFYPMAENTVLYGNNYSSKTKTMDLLLYNNSKQPIKVDTDVDASGVVWHDNFLEKIDD